MQVKIILNQKEMIHVETISYRVSDILVLTNVIDAGQKDLCAYGIELFLTSTIEILSVLLISIIVNNFICTLLF